MNCTGGVLVVVFYLYFVNSAALQSGADAEVNGLVGIAESRVKRDVHVWVKILFETFFKTNLVDIMREYFLASSADWT